MNLKQKDEKYYVPQMENPYLEQDFVSFKTWILCESDNRGN